jgi:hypothetical protein
VNKYNLVVGLVLSLTLPTSRSSAAEPNDCTLHRFASLDLTVGPRGPVLVPVSIEDRSVMMILDTAQVFSFIWQDSADRLSLHAKPMPAGLADVGFGGRRIESYATASSLSVGAMRFEKVDLLVAPVSSGRYSGGNDSVVGVLGMNLLSKSDIDLDIAHRKLNLYSTDHCRGRVVYWASSYASVPAHRDTLGTYSFPIELDGKKIEATLSPGNQLTTLSTDVTRHLYHFDASSPDVQSEPNSAGGTTAHYRAVELTTNGLSVMNAQIALTERERSTCQLTTIAGASGYSNCLGVYPLELGFNILSRMHLYLATKEQVLYFTAAEVAKTESPAQ